MTLSISVDVVVGAGGGVGWSEIDPQCHKRVDDVAGRRYREAVKLARDPDVRNEKIIRTFQRAYAGARKVNPGRLTPPPIIIIYGCRSTTSCG